MAFCTECGAENLPEAAFCTSCGVPLSEVPAGPAASAASTAQTAAPQAPVAPNALAPQAAAPLEPSVSATAPVPQTETVAPQAPAPPAPQAQTVAPQVFAAPAPQAQTFAPQAPAQPSFIGVLWSSLDTGSRVAGIGAIVAAIAFFLPLYAGGFNGVDLAKADIAWWFRFLLPLAVVALLGFTYNRDLRTKILVGTALCAIGAMWGLQVFGVFKGSEFTAQGQEVGWYALHLGLLAILVGGFMSVLDHSRGLIGVR